MEFLENTAPIEEVDSIYALVLSGIWTDKTAFVEVNRYGDISDNDKTENNFHIVCFTYVS